MFCIHSSHSSFLPQTANVVRPTEKKILKGKMTEFVPPQIRTVLKTYQNSATKSLHGPGQSLVSHHTTSSSNSSSSSGSNNSNNNNVIGIDNNISSSNKNISIINNSHGINSSLGLSNNNNNNNSKTINNGYLSNENNAANREIGSNIGNNMNKNNNSNKSNNNSNNDSSSTINNNINNSSSSGSNSNNNNGAPLNFCSGGGTLGIIKKELHSPTNSSDASSLDLNECSGGENQTNSTNINASSSTHSSLTTLSSSLSSFSSLSSSSSSAGTELITSGLIVRPPSLPEIPQPILTAPDPGTGELYETILEGKSIGCFLLGGEMRLCLPQFLNNVLTDFTLDQINRIFDDLRIFCSQCTPEQLMEFKAAKILPDDVKASGLITRTDAERLCSALLHRSDRVNVDIPKSAFSFKVYHRCFGKCEGLFTPDLYSYEKPACIMCLECKGMFSPQKFVGHVHRQKENRTCHWGFDSRNWREYLLVGLDVENREKCSKILDEIRDIEQQEMLNAQQRDISYLKRKVDLIDDPLLETQLPLCKQGALDIPSKRAKIIDEPSYLLEYQRYQQALYYAHVRREQLSAFRPWAPKPMLHLPYNSVTAAVAANAVASAAAAAASLPYFSQEPPILQNPERVVRHTDTELFERTFQPNVALAPRKNILTKERERDKEREKEVEHRDDREREQYHYDKQHQQQYLHNHLQHSRNNNNQNQFGNLLNETTEVYIKQERPSTPDVFTQPFPEKVRITSPGANLSNNLSQLQEQRHQNRRNNHHHIHQHQQPTAHSQYATRISSNHVTQENNFPHFHHHSQDQQPQQKHYQHQSLRHNVPTTTAAISPEERSGSNEITSSTSPVSLNSCGSNNNNNGKITPEQNLIQHPQQATTITAIKLQKTANNSMIANIPNHAHHISSNINCNNINKDKLNSDNVRPITTAPILQEQYLINSTSYKSNIKAIHTLHPQQSSPQSSPSLSSNTLSLGLDSNMNTADGVLIKNITTNGGLHEYSIACNKNAETTILQSSSGRIGPFIGNSEFELSTDTDDDSLAGEPDSSNMTGAWDLATDALRHVQPNDRDKVLYVVKMLAHENTQLRLEKSHLLQELRVKDEQITDLRRELRYSQRQSASPSPQMSPVLGNNIPTFTSIKQKMISSCATNNNINYNHSASKNNNDHSNNNNNNNTNINNNNNKVSSNSNGGVIAKVESCSSAAGSTTSPTKQNQQQQYHVVLHKSESEKIKVPPKKSSRHSPEDTVVVLNHHPNVHRDEVVTGVSKSSITETNSTSLSSSSTLSFSSSSPSASSSLSHNSPLSFGGTTNNNNNINEKNDSSVINSNNNNNNSNNNNNNNNSNCSSSLNTTKVISESEDDGVAATSSASSIASSTSSGPDSIKYERKLPKYQ